MAAHLIAGTGAHAALPAPGCRAAVAPPLRGHRPAGDDLSRPRDCGMLANRAGRSSGIDAVRLQMFWLAVSLSIPAVCMVLAATHAADPLLLTDVALPGLLSCWIVALVAPFLFGGNESRVLRRTAFVLKWSAIAIVFPLSWDLPRAILHDWVNGATAQDTSKWYFWAYAVADTRSLRSDPLTILVEYWSGVIGVVEIIFMTLFLRNRTAVAIRFFIAAGCFQFYGCTVFFVSQLVRHLADTRPDALSYLKFFDLNGMWMVVPAVSGYLLIQLTTDPDYDARRTARILLGKPPEALARNVVSSTRDTQTAAR